MANFPTSKRPSYLPEKKPQEGRRNLNPFYQSMEWRKCTKQFLKENPLCAECLKNGRTTPSKVSDHIKPINQVNAYDTQHGRFGDPLEWNNLQPLCERCHAKKSGKERHQ